MATKGLTTEQKTTLATKILDLLKGEKVNNQLITWDERRRVIGFAYTLAGQEIKKIK